MSSKLHFWSKTGNFNFLAMRLVFLLFVLLLFLSIPACKPDNPWDAKLDQAEELFLTGDFPEAIKTYREILSDWPNSPAAEISLWELARINNHYLADYTEAIRYYYLIVNADPKSALAIKARKELAQIYSDVLHDLNKTAEQYNMIINDAPSEYNLEQEYLSLGQCLLSLHNFDAAENLYLSFIDKYPTSSKLEQAIYYIALIQQYQGRYKEAIQSFTDFLQNFPESDYDLDSRIAIAECYEELTFYQKAVEILEGIEDPKDKGELITYKLEKIRRRMAKTK